MHINYSSNEKYLQVASVIPEELQLLLQSGYTALATFSSTTLQVYTALYLDCNYI